MVTFGSERRSGGAHTSVGPIVIFELRFRSIPLRVDWVGVGWVSGWVGGWVLGGRGGWVGVDWVGEWVFVGLVVVGWLVYWLFG